MAERRKARRRAAWVLLPLLLAACSVVPEGTDRCRETTLPGRWVSNLTGNVWVFGADGVLACEGPCRFTRATGQPISWAYEPAANVWSLPIEHVKLEFERGTFEGVFGSFRCLIANQGRTLRLEAEDHPEDPMVFTREGY